MLDPDALFVAGVRLLPRRSLSRWARRVVDLRSSSAVRWFASTYSIDLSDADAPLEGYASIHELFTRRLRPGARPIDPTDAALVSPADGRLSACGAIGTGELPQAKGRSYTLRALLADEAAAEAFRSGSFATIYLSPRDYHRVHAPAEGVLVGWTHVPGDLYPVNRAAVTHVDALFARNERLVSWLETPTFGRVAVVKVGATIVGRVRATYAPEVTTNLPGQREVRAAKLPAARLIGRGDELGVFEMGSTVIVVTERPVRFTSSPGSDVRLGRAIGRAG